MLVEAGHRCAIPTCRATTTEIAHIVPWDKVQEHTFENLIALCPNCHTRYDQKKEIDPKAMAMYKKNLGLLNHRYGEIERRLFTKLAASNAKHFALGSGGDIFVANAVADGIFQEINGSGGRFSTYFEADTGVETLEIPATFVYRVTDHGRAFIQRYANGEDLE